MGRLAGVLVMLVVSLVSGDDGSFLGFWKTNYNETITMCVFDELRGVLLGRTHWPDEDFNDDSAALQSVLITEDWLSGVGSTIAGGAYSFTMKLNQSQPDLLTAYGSFDFINKAEQGEWIWSYVREATERECKLVTQVREINSSMMLNLSI